MLKLGESGISSLYLGNAKIKKAYLGSDLVFEGKKSGRLPEGYTEVEYIYPKDNASQINTYTYLLKAGSSIELDLDINVSTLGSYYFYIFSCIRVASSRYYGVAANILTKTLNARFFNGNSVSSETAMKASLGSITLPGSLNLRYVQNEQSSTTKYMWINGVKKSFSLSTSVASLNTTTVYLGGGGIPTNTAHTQTSGAIRYKSVKINNSDDPSADWNADLVPCINPSGVVGMYDLVKDTFCQHKSATYKWGAGPAV